MQSELLIVKGKSTVCRRTIFLQIKHVEILHSELLLQSELWFDFLCILKPPHWLSVCVSLGELEQTGGLEAACLALCWYQLAKYIIHHSPRHHKGLDYRTLSARAGIQNNKDIIYYQELVLSLGLVDILYLGNIHFMLLR